MNEYSESDSRMWKKLGEGWQRCGLVRTSDDGDDGDDGVGGEGGRGGIWQ